MYRYIAMRAHAIKFLVMCKLRIVCTKVFDFCILIMSFEKEWLHVTFVFASMSPRGVTL